MPLQSALGGRAPAADAGSATLRAQVRDALVHLHDPAVLERHPLARPVRVGERPAARTSPGQALRRELLEAIAALGGGARGPEGRARRGHRLLTLRYVEGWPIAAVRRELAVGRSEYFREHRRALEALAELLDDRRRAARTPAAAVDPRWLLTPVALRAPAAGNLPAQLTRFVGRAHEVEAVKGLLGSNRLVTLTGTGGVGKTRLALRVAADRPEAYPDGAWFVDLAPIADETLVPRAVLAALGLREVANRPPVERLVEHLRSRTALVLLDNCEHLIGACARLADALLRACADVRVLATSRELLGVAGEAAWRVPSLSLPDLADPSPEQLMRYDAVQLFVDRARLLQPTFALTAHNAASVAQICHRLDGIPLAIELAAARVPALALDQLASRLQDRFRLLTGGSRTALRRQQTLRATIDWSHDLLAEAERVVLRRLSVFAGGCTLEAAEAVCAGDGVETEDVLDLVTQLVGKSLVLADVQEGGTADGREGRYRLLETTRQYAEGKLLEAGEAAAVRAHHLDWYLALAEEAAGRFYGPGQRLWMDRIEREHDNMRAALGWCLGAAAVEPGLRLADALGRFWAYRVHGREGWAWVQQLLARAREAPDDPALRAARARALTLAHSLARWVGEIAAAAPLIEEAVALARTLDEAPALPLALANLGLWRSHQGRHAEARELLAEALALARRLGDPATMGWAPIAAGSAAFHAGDLPAARAILEECLAERRGVGDESGTARALEWLGNVALAGGDAEGARGAYAEALSLFREADDRAGSAHVLLGLGMAAVEQNDATEAERRLRTCLAIEREIGDRASLPATLHSLAGAAALRAGDAGASAAERALRLAGAAASAGDEAPPDWWQWEAAMAQRRLAPAFAALGGWGAPAAEAAMAAGRAMTAEEAIAYALGDEDAGG